MITRRTLLSILAAAPLRSASLPEQSAAAVLDRAFPDPSFCYLLTNHATGREICSRWPHPLDPVPVGSLVKPFTALAYGEAHDFQFPRFLCTGVETNCWLPQGHGPMNIRSAIAHSCNAYFLSLARELQPEALTTVVQRYTLPPPDPQAEPPAWIGLGTGWRISPVAIARAYSELLARRSDPGVGDILAGMALSARSGTGRGAGAGSYVKTGTAHCIHEAQEPGDGYVIALSPAAAPCFNLLVRVHGVPGAK